MNANASPSKAPANDVALPAVRPYRRHAEVFSRVFHETGSLEISLEVYDAYRTREALAPARPDILDRVLTVAGSLFGVPRKRVLDRRRHNHLTSARYVAAWLLRRRQWSTPRIGEVLGLDHSTILSGLRKVANTTELLVAAHKAELLLKADEPDVGEIDGGA
jgi:hypothetical protein